MGYFVSLMGYFGVQWPIILGHLAFQVDPKVHYCFGGFGVSGWFNKAWRNSLSLNTASGASPSDMREFGQLDKAQKIR